MLVFIYDIEMTIGHDAAEQCLRLMRNRDMLFPETSHPLAIFVLFSLYLIVYFIFIKLQI